MLLISFAALIIGVAIGYGYGTKVGYKSGDADGFARAEDQAKKLQEAAGQKAATEAAKAANPFQTTNPLQSVDTNPFEKAKKVLNPFQ
ncbi:MAG: hypothetical protein G01um101433_941 [Parcubacteria group bacterium Gr01-1014_33]|nr:MAG: hypothetical protein G01um101433_941 [Parcubacteria group bacterium Gr01-1014_33]